MNFQFTQEMLKKIETKTLLLWGDKDQVSDKYFYVALLNKPNLRNVV